MKKRKNHNKIILIFVFIIILSLVYLIYNNIEKENNNNASSKNKINSINKDNKDSKDNKDNEQKDTDQDNNIDDETIKNDESIPKTEVKENEAQTEAKNLNVSSIELVGDEEITLNVGDKYTEFGAKAYNVDGMDISSEIKIDSSVDTSKQGRYTVSYSIGNFIVMRYVIVK